METWMYAKLIMTGVRKLEGQVATLMEKCSEPEASPPVEGEVIDLEEGEEGNSEGTNQDQRGHQREMTDDLGQFKKRMKNDCRKIRDDVDYLLKLAQLLTHHVKGSGDRANSKSANQATAAPLSSTSVEPTSSIMAGRRSPTSAMGLIKTGDPTGRAGSGALSPTSLDSTGDAGFTAGQERVNEGRISTTSDSVAIAVGEGQNSTGALKKKRIRNRINPGVAAETEDSAIHTRKGRISSKPDLGVSKETRTLCKAKPPPKLLQVGNRAGLGNVMSGESDTIRGSNDAVPTSLSAGPSTKTQELLSALWGTCPKQSGVNADDHLANPVIDAQSTSATSGSASSSNSVSPAIPSLKQAQTALHVETPGHSESATHHSSAGDTTLECIFCHKNLSSKWALETHTMGHIGERPHFCSLCPYESTNRGNLNRHLETHNAARETKQFECEICQKLFSTKGNLNKHISEVHEKKRLFKCEECPKAFSTKDNLKRHMLTHTGEKNHMRGHTLERPFKCSFCGKFFKYRSEQRKHERSHLHQ